jgi:hypothetical protein
VLEEAGTMAEEAGVTVVVTIEIRQSYNNDHILQEHDRRYWRFYSIARDRTNPGINGDG